MKIDYHIHTKYSDGICSVEDIVNLISKNQIQYFSITDHDTLGADSEINNWNLNNSVFVTGIEFTCAEQTINQLSYPFSIHLLGYGLDCENKELKDALAERKKRVNSTFLSLLKALHPYVQHEIFMEEIPISCGIVMQLCDIHNYIKANFPLHYEQTAAIIDSYAMPLSRENISIKDAISLIHNAGGKAVWAHPFHIYRNFQKNEISLKEVEYVLHELLKLNIDGIEANYLDFSYNQRNKLLELAHKNNIFSTGGSDYHGSHGRNSIGIDIPETQNPFG